MPLSFGFTSELDDSAAKADCYRLRAIACPKFFHDVLYVYFHSLFGYEELLRDVAISISTGYLTQHFYLTGRQSLVTQMFR